MVLAKTDRYLNILRDRFTNTHLTWELLAIFSSQVKCSL